jgi:hypothetical protein
LYVTFFLLKSGGKDLFFENFIITPNPKKTSEHTIVDVKTQVPTFLQWFGFKPRDFPFVVLDTDYSNYSIAFYCDESPYFYNKNQILVKVRNLESVESKDSPLAKIIKKRLEKLSKKYKFKPNLKLIKNDEKSCLLAFENFKKDAVIPDYFTTKPETLLTVKTF